MSPDARTAGEAQENPTAVEPVATQIVEPCAPERARRLEPGSRVERNWLPPEVHCYEIALRTGDFLEIAVSQEEGLDVELILQPPLGDEVKFDFDDQGLEPLLWHAAQEGSYRVLLAGYEGAQPGTYTLRTLHARPATEQDRKRVVAVRLLASADLARRGAGDLPENQATAAREVGVGLYEEAAERLLTLGEVRLASIAQDRLSLLWRALWERDNEVAALRRAIVLSDQCDSLDRRASLRSRLGNLSWDFGDLIEAEGLYREAMDIYSSAGELDSANTVRGNLGALLTVKGDFGESESQLEEALHFWEENSNPRSHASALISLGVLYLNASLPVEARSQLLQAQEILEQERVAGGRAGLQEIELLSTIGKAYLEPSSSEEANEILQAAQELARTLGDASPIPQALVHLGALDYKEERYDQAVERFTQAAELFRDARIVDQEVLALVGLCRSQQELGLFEDASKSASRILDRSETSGYRYGKQLAQAEISKIELAIGQLTNACTAALEAIHLLELRRSSSDRIDFRSAFFSSNRSYFQVAVDACLSAGRSGELPGAERLAFELSDRSRARRLRDLIAAKRSDREREPADFLTLEPPAVDREQLLAAITQAGASLRAARNPEETRGAKEEQAASLLDYRKRNRIRSSGDLQKELDKESPFLLLEEVQQELLDSETLLLQYDLGPRRSLLWAITDEQFEVFELPPATEVVSAVRELRSLLVESYRLEAQESLAEALQKVSEMFLEPVAFLLKERSRVAIVADGPLHEIPFDALTPPTNSEELPSILLRSHQLVYPLSASSMAWLRKRSAGRPPVTQGVAVIADPVFDREDSRLTPSLAGFNDRRQLRGILPSGLARLDNSRREADAVLSHYRDHERLQLLGFEATKQAVKRANLARFQTILFSTHGASHPDHPEFSFLELTRIDSKGRSLEGTLYASEISQLDLAAELVVLSACESGLGAGIAGDGPVGLSHSFLAAGASKVLVSLWQVDDESSADLIALFFEFLVTQRLQPAEALRRAKLSVRDREGDERPFFWSGFVLRGDW